ncbi:MAG: GPW/gp25 family protein [Thiomicrorhabdus sp.]|jgi:phage baseplate assembly protein W|nr:GPW/gp25 family protein [Thiomicrorhabdus sp.]
MQYTYSDFSPTLDLTPSGNIRVVYDEAVIIQSIKSIMATVSGERVRSPIGSKLVKYLFQTIQPSTANLIKRELTKLIETYEQRVDIQEVLVVGDIDNNRYDIHITLLISEINKTINFETRLRSFS